MRSLPLILAVLLVLAAPVLAQPAGQGRPPWWPEEEFKAYMEVQQKLQTAFSMKDYKGGLPILEEELKLLESVKAKLEDGTTVLPEHPQATPEQIKRMALSRLGTSIAGCWYNRACCYSMTGETDAAVKALKKSILLGYLEVAHMKTDPDLGPIRSDPGFKEALDLINYNDEFAVHVPEGLGEAPAALLVMLHSAGSNEGNVINVMKDLADEMKLILLAPRGPIIQGTGQFAWKNSAVGKDNGVRKVEASIAAVREKHTIDGSRIYVIGSRQGGEIATLYAYRNPGKVRGAAQLNTYWNRFDFNDEKLLLAASTGGVKLCLIHGKEDPFFGKAEQAIAHYEKAKLAAKLIAFDGGKDLPDKETLYGLLKQAVAWLSE